MNDIARVRIYNRLRAAITDTPVVDMSPADQQGRSQGSPLRVADAPAVEISPPEILSSLTLEEKITGLTERMSVVHTEVFRVKRNTWQSKLTEIIQSKKIGSLLYGPGTWLAKELEAADQNDSLGDARPKPYDNDVESFKKELFDIDAGITTTTGGIADLGALILWPTKAEPRLISLVPPIHIAVVEAKTIYGSLSEAMQDQDWSEGMPTNALLISGPSKTADIEFILIYGVHGPKELVVIIIED